ncbi:hypothetical protein T492DRAFT_1001342 [Pavlovales sp. CCMP2436]|nr:hypothetical protein T492DRAFT_1001342 [Pavlovales sp. CCMP2436]|mmetsp:Transcript_5554/g.13850  ORF Transcript_5554/g.13850 Transcript_5554/m.13850 type:complete len:294 (+) Transcript_5554:86-967(+)
MKIYDSMAALASTSNSATSHLTSAADECIECVDDAPEAMCTLQQLDAQLVDGGTAKKPATKRGDAAHVRLFQCEVCRKTFKRENNLTFHLSTHTGVGEQSSSWDAPVSCAECPKIFATKYQAKKHHLRRHFQGPRRFSCTRCNLKAFAVREDLTTHSKTCGRTFACACGARPRSIAALNKHCAQSGHSPAASAIAAAAAAATAAADVTAGVKVKVEDIDLNALSPLTDASSSAPSSVPSSPDADWAKDWAVAGTELTASFLASIGVSDLPADMMTAGFFAAPEDFAALYSIVH